MGGSVHTGGGMLRDIMDRLVALERAFTRRGQGVARSEGVMRGTPAAREEVFPTPTNAAEHAALANRKVLWYNTERGWLESYYATTGTPGLAAIGLRAGIAPGWYPTGPGGPFHKIVPTVQIAPTVSNRLTWSGDTVTTGGIEWFEYSAGTILVKKPGRYRVRAWTTQLQGSGTTNYHLRMMSEALSVERFVDGNAFTLNPTLYTRAHSEGDFEVPGPRRFDFFLHAGVGMTLHMGSSDSIRGEFIIEYLGPLLVNAP